MLGVVQKLDAMTRSRPRGGETQAEGQQLEPARTAQEAERIRQLQGRAGSEKSASDCRRRAQGSCGL